MTDEILKITTYLGERSRSDGVLAADALLKLYGRRRVRTSVMLRGIEGFGASHREHTDLSLTLSEDLPVVTVAVDAAEHMEPLLPEVRELIPKGLVTLERARGMPDNAPQAQDDPKLPEDLRGEAKLSVYVGRHERVGGRPAFVAVCELLKNCGLYGACALIGVDGTHDGNRTRAKLIGSNAEVPVLVMSVGPGTAVADAITGLRTMLPELTATLERVNVTRRAGAAISDPRPTAPVLGDGNGHWHKLTIYSSEDDRSGHHPLHREIVRSLRREQLAGATSLRGIWGFEDDDRPHGDRLLQARRHTPVVTITVDTPERIAAIYPQVQRLTANAGLVTLETVPILA